MMRPYGKSYMANEQKGTVVCVDALGGDAGCEPILAGVEKALQSDENLRILLAGTKDVVEPFAAKHDRAEPLIATENIEMDEHPAEAVRKKRDSSIVLGCKAVKQGRASAFFSAGSTGAILTAATLYVGRIRGVLRPALVSVLPALNGHDTVMLDLGANADCRDDMIVQFARMGALFARLMLQREHVRVALLSNGTEPSKGSEGAQKYYAALQNADQRTHEHDTLFSFAGYCEGNDLLRGAYDVIVTDGFTGNVSLKSLEAAGSYIIDCIKAASHAPLKNKLGAALLFNTFKQISDKFSATEHGGAFLMGVAAPVFIGHGQTHCDAVCQAILSASHMSASHICETITKAFSLHTNE